MFAYVYQSVQVADPGASDGAWIDYKHNYGIILLRHLADGMICNGVTHLGPIESMVTQTTVVSCFDDQFDIQGHVSLQGSMSDTGTFGVCLTVDDTPTAPADTRTSGVGLTVDTPTAPADTRTSGVGLTVYITPKHVIVGSAGV